MLPATGSDRTSTGCFDSQRCSRKLLPIGQALYGPPQSMSVSCWLCTPSVQVGGMHRPDWQLWLGNPIPICIACHSRRRARPPQSTSVSLPRSRFHRGKWVRRMRRKRSEPSGSRRPPRSPGRARICRAAAATVDVHLAAVPNAIETGDGADPSTHALLAQSCATRHDAPVAQVPRAAPPQSTSVSSESLTPSPQALVLGPDHDFLNTSVAPLLGTGDLIRVHPNRRQHVAVLLPVVQDTRS